jgi:putative transcriptional regulator
MVKDLRERLADKRAAERDSERYGAVATMPEPVKETNPVSEPITTNHATAPAVDAQPMTPERIRAIREKHHLSQDNLGKWLKITGVSVSNWENGKASVSARFIEPLIELEAMEPMPKRGAHPDTNPAETRAMLAEYRAKKAAKKAAEEAAMKAAEAMPESTVRPELDSDVEPAPIDYPTDPAEIARSMVRETDRLRALRAEARAESLQARLNELEIELANPPKALSPHIRDNLDAFRLLVRTFGIDTADQVVELLRG